MPLDYEQPAAFSEGPTLTLDGLTAGRYTVQVRRNSNSFLEEQNALSNVDAGHRDGLGRRERLRHFQDLRGGGEGLPAHSERR